jgi:superfamily II DNA or RNA helicase
VVTADAEHARAVARAMREITGSVPTVVVHTDANAHAKLDAFRRGTDPWIVAVNMVSEGVDIPRLRVGVYSTVAKTPLIFRQIVGRFVRVVAGRAPELSYVFLPADRGLRALAADVETELRHHLHAKDDGPGDGLLDDDELERAARVETELDETGFVPLSADVAPQMALFASADAPAPVIVASTPAAATAAPVEPEPEPEMSAFERRAALRAERHTLVSNLRRLDGRSHAEINAAVNRSVGIRRVEDATIDQLQKSIQLLLRELDKTKSKARPRSRGLSRA